MTGSSLGHQKVMDGKDHEQIAVVSSKSHEQIVGKSSTTHEQTTVGPSKAVDKPPMGHQMP